MKKVIVTTISITLVLVLAIGSLVLALIPVNKNNTIAKPDEIYIMNKITSDNTNNKFADKSLHFKYSRNDVSAQTIDSFYDVFNSSFGQNLLLAILRGELGDGLIAEKYADGNYSTGSISKNYSTNNAFTVVFRYNEDKNLKYNDTNQKYNYLFFEVKNEDYKTSVSFGVSYFDHTKNNGSLVSNNTSYSSFSYTYKYSAKINTFDMYNFLTNLSDFRDYY